MNPKESYRISDELWAKMQLLLSVHVNTHPFGGGRPCADDRKCMDAIGFVLRTGCRWDALDATGSCPSSTAHDRFQEWVQAGVFERLWEAGLLEYHHEKGLEWAWHSMDGAMTRVPWAGKECGPNPTDQAKEGGKRSLLTEVHGAPVGLTVDRANRNDFQMMRETLESTRVKRPQPTRSKPQSCARTKSTTMVKSDSWRRSSVTRLISEAAAQRLKHQAGFEARRWVVERTHSWTNRLRRILTRWEEEAENYLALLHLVCAIITYRCAGVIRMGSEAI